MWCPLALCMSICRAMTKKPEDFHTALIIISHVIQLGGGGCKGLPVKHLIRSNI